MEEMTVDLVVIGAGPAGQKAAIQGAKLGKKVIVIDKLPEPGGNCLYSGTIPSKSLREAIIDLTRFYERGFNSGEFALQEVSIPQLNQRLHKVIEEERSTVYRQLRKNGIRLINGTARFENPHMLIVMDEDYRLLHQINTEFVVIATGSKPRNPNNIPFDNDVIFDSTRLLGIEKIPSSLIVLGGGIIGSEYASFFAALGTEVTVIDKKDHILPSLDPEIGIILQTSLKDLGLRFLGNKEAAQIARINNKAYVKCKDGTEISADALLFALGRSAYVDGLHIENAGLSVNNKGYIPVNALFQTERPNIYAVGDVIGGPCLASTSMEQGRLAARHAFGVHHRLFPNLYPIGIYTIPEISSCGYNEDELREMGFRYEVGRAYYYEIARSHIVGSNTGMFKILFHAETLEILGVHIIGRSATEVIHIGQVAMSFNAKIDYFIDQVFNYPTYAEGYRIAALNGFNKISYKKYVDVK
ncbi:putative soluble pyridine nucleotide transhydrogenase|uniref:Si-specific NAD(P)(+) transhydrogenase n=2 Tax=unclassified Neochlamydia TaxID=2643326 RepID=UPI00140A889D|nr:Si-specific NAD(P)(+) transhydrogenase [Neochlamydia sp. AcF84]MBS4170874.1 putative soluble pyridine nucleotide transhydrogenase [Neochlamydia sp. AcF95]NGY94861.1 putative soluble pyridine nucleotide transhydrogenase [Neochlamydia sp. AcF84]